MNVDLKVSRNKNGYLPAIINEKCDRCRRPFETVSCSPIGNFCIDCYKEIIKECKLSIKALKKDKRKSKKKNEDTIWNLTS